MEPQQTPNQVPPVQPMPQPPAPQPAPVAAPPSPMPIPAPMPGPSQPYATPQVTGIQNTDVSKERTQSLLLGGASLAVFVIGLLIGFAAVLGALLGAFGARKAILIKYTPGIVLGITGLVVNLGWYLLAVLAGN